MAFETIYEIFFRFSGNAGDVRKDGRCRRRKSRRYRSKSTMRGRSRSHRIISAQRITSARLFHALTQMGVPPWLMRPKEKLIGIFQVNSDGDWIAFPDFLDSAIPAFVLQDISISRSEIYSELIHGCKASL
eukprot:408246_1